MGRTGFLRELRRRAPSGAPVALFLEAWSELPEVVADGPAAEAALRDAAGALPPLAGALAERRALAAAVFDPRGGAVCADAAFQALFADGSEFRGLMRRAQRDGSAVGLVEGSGGAAFTAWVGAGPAAGRFPLDAAARSALAAGSDRLAVVVAAPSRSSALARSAARALDLTDLEARLAEALLFAPNLEMAAAAAGVGRATARDALERITRKAGVRRTPELVGRLIELMCAAPGAPASDEQVAEQALGLTPAEARVAGLIVRGRTAPEAAVALGVSPETVKTHLRAVFRKTGVGRAKDLARLIAEGRELVALADAADPIFADEAGGGRLRVLPAGEDDRRIALIDYGPYRGDPVLVFHGAAAGRRLPPAAVERLHAAGYRPIVVQRPGFGLTDPARRDYVATGAGDLAAVVEGLRLRKVRLLARDTGAPTALEFVRAFPALVSHLALLNPHAPAPERTPRDTMSLSVQRHLLRNPELVAAFAEFLRRQATTELLGRMVRRTCDEAPADREALRDPGILDFMVRDIQAMCARSAKGFAAEHGVYAAGWRPPQGLPAVPCVVGLSLGVPAAAPLDWLTVPVTRVVGIPEAGLLPQFTHPDALVGLLA